jgi:hypothetical protein
MAVKAVLADAALNDGTVTPGAIMQALTELFTTDVGLMSIGVIAFMLGMGGFFLRYFLRHMHEDEAREHARSGR